MQDEHTIMCCSNVKGVGVGKTDIFFRELTPSSRAYELRSRGGGDVQNQDKQTPHTVLQKLSPKPTHTPLK